MPEPLDPRIIDRYLAGEASPSDLDALRAHRERDPAWAAAIDALRAANASDGRANTTGTPPTWDTDAAWSRLESRIGAGKRPDVRSIGRAVPGRRFPAARYWLLAAGLVVTAGALAWRMLARRPAGGASQTLAMREVVTPNGARNTFTLDDGSRVTLNAGSRLRWAQDFGARTRDVHLEGEAYFVVTHDGTRPFRVHARGGVAHDLGTRFTVRAYPELSQIEVAVAEGAVSLRRDSVAATDSAIVRAGQLGRLAESGAPVVDPNVAMDRWTAWTSGSLVLDGLTLAEAVPQLERWYDAKIVIADPRLANRRVSARFNDEALPQMLDALTLALGARWRQSGRSITLSPADR